MTPLRRCWDLSESHIKEAMSSRGAMGKLLREMAAIARPDSGATKILLAIARMAKPTTCDWIDGALRVEIEGVDGKTRFTVMEDLGGGMRELVFPRLLLDAPLAEFDRSLRLAVRAIAPLQLSKESGDKFVLTNRKPQTSHKPPPFELAEDCLWRSLPPAVRESVAPPPAPPNTPADPILKRRARPTKPPPEGIAPTVLEIPRVAKTLDLGDFASPSPSPPPNPKRPSRRPPRG